MGSTSLPFAGVLGRDTALVWRRPRRSGARVIAQLLDLEVRILDHPEDVAEGVPHRADLDVSAYILPPVRSLWPRVRSVSDKRHRRP